MLKRAAFFVFLGLLLISLLAVSQLRHSPLMVSGLLESQEVGIGSRVGGRVQRVLVREGATVEAGQVLVELEPFDLYERRAEAAARLAEAKAEHRLLAAGYRSEEIAQAKARRDRLAASLQKLQAGPRKQEIAAAQAQVELEEARQQLAQITFTRVDEMFKGSAANRDELDRATEELKVAQAAVAVERQRLSLLQEGTRAEEIAEAQAQLEEAQQAWQQTVKGSREEDIARAEAAVAAAEGAFRSIERAIEELQIRAPITGVVDSMDLQPGDLVTANAPVLTLSDPRELWVRAYVPQDKLYVTLGQAVTVTVDSYPGEQFPAKITFIARQAEFTPSNVQTPEQRSKQVFRVKATLQEGHGRLRPGMPADVWLERASDTPLPPSGSEGNGRGVGGEGTAGVQGPSRASHAQETSQLPLPQPSPIGSQARQGEGG